MRRDERPELAGSGMAAFGRAAVESCRPDFCRQTMPSQERSWDIASGTGEHAVHFEAGLPLGNPSIWTTAVARVLDLNYLISDREANEIWERLQPELSHCGCPVCLDGLYAEVELRRDLQQGFRAQAR